MRFKDRFNIVELKCYWAKTKTRICWFLAERIPRQLLFWSLMRAGRDAACGPLSNVEVPKMTFIEMLDYISDPFRYKASGVKLP